jgi:hypothetical protein
VLAHVASGSGEAVWFWGFFPVGTAERVKRLVSLQGSKLGAASPPGKASAVNDHNPKVKFGEWKIEVVCFY